MPCILMRVNRGESETERYHGNKLYAITNWKYSLNGTTFSNFKEDSIKNAVNFKRIPQICGLAGEGLIKEQSMRKVKR